MKLIIFISFIFSIILDITLSEYPNYIHPVFYIGCVGKFFDKILKREKFKNKFLLVFLGFLSLILEIIIWLFLIIIFEYMLKITFFNSQIFIYYLIYSIFYIFILKSTFSIKALYNHVKNCDTENIEELRKNVSKIVSRNTSILNQNQLYSAALESLSENIHDSIIGPHFYFMLFGLKGAFIYRIINTYDALFGYRNEKYEYFGKTHARLDDFFNFIPARISCFIMFFLILKVLLNI
jgi:adenosylcobinamide-phosphate synthase